MPRILLIQSSTQPREDILDILELVEFTTFTTETLEDSLALVEMEAFDVILCTHDLNSESLMLFQHLRSHPSASALPFIFLTSRLDYNLYRQAMELGADDVLVSPFQPDSLLKSLLARIERRKIIAEMAEKSFEGVRERMMRMVTHELRTPLSSITMVTDIISRQMYSTPVSELRELLETMTGSSKRLGRVIDQIVLITQLNAGTLDKRSILEAGMPMSMWEIMVAAVGMARRFSYRQPNVNIELVNHHKEAQVSCNLLALRHALSEIIANALNFSPENGTIEVIQWASDYQVWICVRDAGPGMTPEQLSQVMQYFLQFGREGQEQQGMGLGLGLANALIDTHGGTLQVTSQPGLGTQVLITLPRFIPSEVEEEYTDSPYALAAV
jgi:two-component system, sensor histidine kinase and response regulator